MADSDSSAVKNPQNTKSIGGLLQTQAERWAPAFRLAILLCISTVATLVRVFSVNQSLSFPKNE